MAAKLVSVTMLLLLLALTEAQQSVPCPGPLSETQLTQLVKGSVPAARIGQLVASCGIDFEPDGGAIGRLRSVGMPRNVLDALRVATGPTERKRQAEEALWESIQDSQDPVAFEDYLRRYPEGQFAASARQKQRELKIAGVRGKVEQSLGDGRWDEAEGLIRDLLPVGTEDEEVIRWQRQIAEGREKLRLEKEAAARAMVQPATIAPGTKKVNPKDGLTYVWIPPGTFMMGCSPGDNECFDSEKPAHRVSISKGFWLGQTPVTQQAYQRVTGQNPSYFKGANLPVETVNWNEAKAYCLAVGGRLPTEAEWEYAARASSTGARYGNLDEIAWYPGNSGGKTHEVGRKQANVFGLFDTLGNVWQWTADWFGDYPSGARSDPSGAVSGQLRALRGGAWICGPRDVRVSSRSVGGPGIRYLSFGLRCVGEPPSPSPAASVSSVPERPVASASASAAVKIRVVSGEDQELSLASGMPSDVTVEVVDATGKPVAGISVAFVFPTDGPRGTTELNQSFAVASTNDQGRASVRVKPAGSAGAWKLRVTAGSDSISVGLTNITEISKLPPPAALVPAGSKRVNPKNGLTYVWIPPGTFKMGCSPRDKECVGSARAHKVSLTKGFWIGQTEVTQEAYQQVVGNNPSHFNGAKLPVETVSWYEAQSYCQAVEMRLPTEAEWEYAARAGSTGARYGSLDEIAWYQTNSGIKTHETRQKQPNAWGLYDMLGNVWEWVADWYADNYPAGSQRDPGGPASGQNRMLRGGSFKDPSWSASATRRLSYVPVARYYDVGLRCAGN